MISISTSSPEDDFKRLMDKKNKKCSPLIFSWALMGKK
jgi:hypothetical protein